MNITHEIGYNLKLLMRIYQDGYIHSLEKLGFVDIRPSFIDILVYVAFHEGCKIKDIGTYCGLKKQTMTTHINELIRRGYLEKKANILDKREQVITFTSQGKRIKQALIQASDSVMLEWSNKVGEVELKRFLLSLENFRNYLQKKD